MDDLSAGAGRGVTAAPPRTWPSTRRRALITFGLTGFAISQPVLSVFGEDPATLAHHGIGGTDLLLFAVLVGLVPAFVLALGSALIPLVHRDTGRTVHLLLVTALVAAFVVQVAKSAGVGRPAVLLVVALGAGATFAIAHVRVPVVSLWASYTAVLPVLAVVFFVVASPASDLLQTPQDGPARTDATGKASAPVVFIVLDELPTRTLVDSHGSIDRARYPHVAAFADDATWYRRATSLATFTSAAVPALLTGQLPTTDPPLWTSHPSSLFTLLAPTHDLEVFETVTAMCPYTSCTSSDDGDPDAVATTGPGFGDLLGVAADVWAERVRPRPYVPPALTGFGETFTRPDLTRASEAVDPEGGRSLLGLDQEAMRSTAVRAEQLMDSFDSSDGPTLYYLHLMLPHQPWVRYRDGDLYRVPDPVNVSVEEDDRPFGWSWSEWVGTVTEQRHTLQAQFVDSLLGQIVDQLRATDLYDQSLVVVMADHGVSFEERSDQRAVTRETIDAVGYSPLLIKAPRQSSGVVDDSNIMTIDVVPTVADLLGLEPSWPVDGAPAGSEAITRRGSRKQIYDYSGFAPIHLDEVIEFDDDEVAADVPRSWLGDLPDPDDPLSALHAGLGIGGLVGRPLDAVINGSGGSIEVDELDEVREAPADKIPFGLVTGRVPGAPDDGVVVLAIDGVVVGGSRFSTTASGRDGMFAVLLPQGALDADNEIRAALLADGEVIELEVRAR